MFIARFAVLPFLLTTLAISGCGTEPAAATSGVAGRIDPAVTSNAVAASSARQPLRPGAKTAALDKAGDRLFDKTFDDVRFEMKPEEPFRRKMLTPAIEQLSGQRIRIRGFMLPTAQQRGIKQFVLVRDNQQCCFGPGAALFDCILVEMQAGQSAAFSIRPVAVTGKFEVNQFDGPDGHCLAIYHMDAEVVE
ncbi:MAG TPA: DUF3299 domain-containing protein [Lacipirellulaceae bacterium]|jgi:hypothetical protein